MVRACVFETAHSRSRWQCNTCQPRLQVPSGSGRSGATPLIQWNPLRRRRQAAVSGRDVVSEALYSESGNSFQAISQFLTLVTAVVGAYYLHLQDSKQQAGKGTDECPRCHGTGKEPCFCNRWSDGDTAGCASCNYTGYAVCKSCRGGGTAVPIPIAIRIDEQQFKSRGPPS